jgi:hypothetical protein
VCEVCLELAHFFLDLAILFEKKSCLHWFFQFFDIQIWCSSVESWLETSLCLNLAILFGKKSFAPFFLHEHKLYFVLDLGLAHVVMAVNGDHQLYKSLKT